MSFSLLPSFMREETLNEISRQINLDLIIDHTSLTGYMEFSAARGHESRMAGFLKGLDHFMSINNFLSWASKVNEKGYLITCIRVQTSSLVGITRNCFPPL